MDSTKRIKRLQHNSGIWTRSSPTCQFVTIRMTKKRFPAKQLECIGERFHLINAKRMTACITFFDINFVSKLCDVFEDLPLSLIQLSIWFCQKHALQKSYSQSDFSHNEFFGSARSIVAVDVAVVSVVRHICMCCVIIVTLCHISRLIFLFTKKRYEY